MTLETTFRAQYFTGDDWQWTGVCASPERARYAAWRGMTGHEQTREAA